MNNTHLFRKQRKHKTSTERSRRVARIVGQQTSLESASEVTGRNMVKPLSEHSRTDGDRLSRGVEAATPANREAVAKKVRLNRPGSQNGGRTLAKLLEEHAEEQFADVKGG